MKILSESMLQCKLDDALRRRTLLDSEVEEIKAAMNVLRSIGEEQDVPKQFFLERPIITEEDVNSYIKLMRDPKAEGRYQLFKRFLQEKTQAHFTEFTNEVKKYKDDISPDSFNGFLAKKVQEGDIVRTGKGKYSLPPNPQL